MILRQKWAAAAAIAMSALTLSAAFTPADARTRRAQGSVVTERGLYTGVSETHRQRGSRTRDATITGPNGGQRNVQDARSWNRAEGTYSRDRVTTFNDGSQRTLDTDVLRTGEGQYEATRTVTGRNGQSRTQTGEIQITREP